MTRAASLPDAVRICVWASATELAGNLVEGTRKPAPRARHAVQASEAILAEARHELDEAIRLYGEVAESWARFGVPAEQGLALRGMGRCLVELGEPVAGASRLAEARDIFGRLGAKRLIDETDELLTEATALSS